MTTRMVLASAAIAAIAAIAPGIASAADKITWGSFSGNTLNFANLDGSAGSTVNVGAGVSGTAFDPAAGRIYWSTDSAIKYADLSNISGTTQTLSTSGATTTTIRGIVVDHSAGKVYWANQSANKISWAALDGSGGGDFTPGGTAAVNGPDGVAIYNGRIYWANDGYNISSNPSHPIAYTNVDGSGGGANNTNAFAGYVADGVSIDRANGYTYWSNNQSISGFYYFGYEGSGGAGSFTFFSESIPNQPHGTAVDAAAGKFYWANFGRCCGQAEIGTADISGGGGSNVADLAHTADNGGALFPSLLKAPSGTASISGTATPGNTLTCNDTWNADDTAGHLYQAPADSSTPTYEWDSDGTPIGGQTASTYQTSYADAGHQITCKATRSNSAGSGTTSTSAPVTPTTVSERVFWVSYSVPYSISFASLDGSGADLNTAGATVSAPDGLALDAAHGRVYWINAGTGAGGPISYENIDGTGGGHDLPTTGQTFDNPYGLVLDTEAGKLYWANHNGNTIAWAATDGSAGGTLAIPNANTVGGPTVSGPSGVALDLADGKIFWTNEGDPTHPVAWAHLDGSGGGNLDITGATANLADGLAIDQTAGKLYWINEGNGTVSVVNLSGGGGGSLSTAGAALSVPYGVAIDHASGKLYVGSYGNNKIAVLNLNGSGGSYLDTAPATLSGVAYPALLEQPSNVSVPNVTGTAAPGQTLSCSNGTWQADDGAAFVSRAPQSYSYQWLRDGSAINGATSTTYGLWAVDQGHDIACRVTAHNQAGDVTVTSVAQSVATLPGRMYWANYSGNALSWAGLDGTGGEDVRGDTNQASGTAIDTAAGKIYWANSDTNEIDYGNLDGSGASATLNTAGATVNQPRGLVLDKLAGKIYWANESLNSISWAALDGSGGGDLDTTGATISSPAGVAIDRATGRIYWANGTADSAPISSAKLDGSGDGQDLDTTGATASASRGPVIDSASGTIYWANRDGNNISYAALDGSGGGQLTSTGATLSGPHGLALDPTTETLVVSNFNIGTFGLVSPSAGAGIDLSTADATDNGALFPSVLLAPSGTGAPSITGSPVKGATLTCPTGSWADDDIGALMYRRPASYAYQWTRNGTNIGSATSSTYMPVTADIGQQIRCRVTASNLEGSADQTSAPVVPAAFGAATKLAFTSSASALTSGSMRTLTAHVEDTYGNTVTTASNMVTFAKVSGAGTVTGLGSAAASSGIASETVTGALAGSISIDATAGGLTTGTTTFTVNPGTATKLVFTSATTTLASGTARVLKAEVRDTAGNKVTTPAHSVTFAKLSGAGTVTGLGSVSSSSGVASKSVTGVLAGAISISATAGGLTTGTTTFTVNPGTATKLVVTSATSTLSSGTARVLKADVRDAAGNKVTTPAHSVTFAKLSGAGTVTGLGSVSSSSGVASKSVTGAVAGSITITASSSGLTSGTTTFTVTQGAAKKLVFTSSTANLKTGTSRTLTVQVQDAAGNKVTSPAKSVTFAKLSGAGTVTGIPATVSSSSGAASRAVKGAALGTITIKATSSGLTQGTTSFKVVP